MGAGSKYPGRAASRLRDLLLLLCAFWGLWLVVVVVVGGGDGME